MKITFFFKLVKELISDSIHPPCQLPNIYLTNYRPPHVLFEQITHNSSIVPRVLCYVKYSTINILGTNSDMFDKLECQ